MRHTSSRSIHQATLILSIFHPRLRSLATSRHLFPRRTSPLDPSFTPLRYFNIRDEREMKSHPLCPPFLRHHFREIFMTILRFLQRRKHVRDLIIRGKYPDEVQKVTDKEGLEGKIKRIKDTITSRVLLQFKINVSCHMSIVIRKVQLSKYARDSSTNKYTSKFILTNDYTKYCARSFNILLIHRDRHKYM